MLHYVEPAAKRALLGKLLDDPAMSRVIVFHPHQARRHRVRRGARHSVGVRVSAIHGNKSQPRGSRRWKNSAAGRARVLVATDIAARGIDVTGISHVINFDLPGATGRL